MVKEPLTAERAWQALGQIIDPEIPVVSIVELGIVRSVEVNGREAHVQLTPTFSACPAYQFMVQRVRSALREIGADTVDIQTVFDPPWTTDWLSAEVREKLRRFGLSTPPAHGGHLDAAIARGAAACPYCGSENTRLTNSFGSASCKAISFCDSCRQPFEELKPL